ncbi:MAG: hypothetical protein DHS20C19_12430 [Acidimicrobiales bacterium]|nr:MAG: hypothetical protein DHS20C19_12430 [Acidimicrobiales bacterium]
MAELPIDLIKSMVVGFVLELIRDRTRIVMFAGAFIAVASIVLVVALDGPVRWLALLTTLLGVAMIVITWGARRLATAILSRFAPPELAEDQREQVTAAIEEAGIPTGPLSGLRFAWRLRRGVGTEAERVLGVARRLQGELDLS